MADRGQQEQELLALFNGRALKTGIRQDIVEMRLYDGQGNLVGHATGTFIVIPSVSIE